MKTPAITLLMSLTVIAALLLTASSPAMAQDRSCCCKMTCKYITVIGNQEKSVEVNQCWAEDDLVRDIEQSCDETSMCIRYALDQTAFWILDDWSGEGCQIKTDSGICAAAALLEDDSIQLAVLREFRDEILSTSPAGRKLIELYYANEDVLIALLDSNPALRTQAAATLKQVVTAVEALLD